VATNGILCWIRQAQGHYLGHFEFFEPDAPEKAVREAKPAKAKVVQTSKQLSDLLAELGIEL
jgi:hypothetical protein